MGCGCGRRKIRNTSSTKKIISSASQEMVDNIKKRQAICDKCIYANPIAKKIINRKRAKVSVRKKCKLIDKPISEIITNLSFKCPEKNF